MPRFQHIEALTGSRRSVLRQAVNGDAIYRGLGDAALDDESYVSKVRSLQRRERGLLKELATRERELAMKEVEVRELWDMLTQAQRAAAFRKYQQR